MWIYIPFQVKPKHLCLLTYVEVGFFTRSEVLPTLIYHKAPNWSYANLAIPWQAEKFKILCYISSLALKSYRVFLA